MQYKHELPKKDNGDRVRIVISMFIHFSECTYKVDVFVKAKHKRSYTDVMTNHQIAIRSLNKDEQAKYKENIHFQYVTKDEIYEAKFKAWQSIKPTLKDE